MSRQVRRRRRPGRTAAALLLALFCLAMTPWVVVQFGSQGRVLNVAEAPDDSVGVVLGAAVWSGGVPSPFLQGRLDQATTLWEQGKLSTVIVSGNSEPYYSEPAAMKDTLIAQGVPAEVIIEDPAGYDTYDTCVRAKEVYGYDQVVLISQYYHLPRAVTTCRLVGVDAIAVGDASVRDNARTWWYGELREIPAAWKMLLDVAVRRQPELGRADPVTGEIEPN
ncbi:vancomycin high temperature exclusion protein [Naumannella halotolerans]|uniref:SanA/YdcF family protein n=1 Tax=Naumannella halotolerans TaxID=993414 RepID=UPI00370D9672